MHPRLSASLSARPRNHRSGLPRIGRAARRRRQLTISSKTRVRPAVGGQVLQLPLYRRRRKLKAGLLLDHGSTILKGGDSGAGGDARAILDKSLLIEAVRYKNPDMQMPPKKKLETDDAIARVGGVGQDGRTVAGRADAPEKRLGPKEFDLATSAKSEHWCWQPVKKPDPAGCRETKQWPKGPDRPLRARAKLEENGLRPAARGGQARR